MMGWIGGRNLNTGSHIATVTFFITFIVIVGYVLVSVVVAVLLENFSAANSRVENEELNMMFQRNIS
jgi:hypothetical protein